MSKFSNFPTLIDQMRTLEISVLKKEGLLKPNTFSAVYINWRRNGQKIARIHVLIDTVDAMPYIKLNYYYGKEHRQYKVKLVSQPSNLGKGKVWYFLCPHTSKRCRKLYNKDGYFFHRDAFDNCIYESQARSKKMRKIEKRFGSYFDRDKIFEERLKKYFKTHYDGKPTKRFLRLQKKIDEIDQISHEEFVALLVS
ncbi:hypothetical protein [Membranihabitans maritimus]|uniref:hypothetical protein n=1 Tax=Membranihabitans maritimus TaxID=2904244 RepID=UPI001F47C926|nr:hypothetical protein [Membranihabitans maritimus]